MPFIGAKDAQALRKYLSKTLPHPVRVLLLVEASASPTSSPRSSCLAARALVEELASLSNGKLTAEVREISSDERAEHPQLPKLLLQGKA